MRNFELKNIDSNFTTGTYAAPEFLQNHIPMVIATAEGEIVDANTAFKTLTTVDVNFKTNPCNLFDLLGMEQPANRQPTAGTWTEQLIKTGNTLKRCFYSYSNLENNPQKFRIYSFIDKGNISQPTTSSVEINTKHHALSNSLAQIHKQAGIAFYKIDFGEKLHFETDNLFELLQRINPGNLITLNDILHKSIIHIDDLAVYNDMLARVEAQQLNSYTCEYRISINNGPVRNILHNATLEYNTNGNLRWWTGILQDVTPFRKVESLKSSAFQISQLIHSQHSLELLLKVIHQVISSLMPAPEMLIALDENTNLAIHLLNGQNKAAETKKKENGLLEYVLKTNEPLLVSASAIDLMVTERIIDHSGQIPQSWIGIPLKTRESVIGVLCLQSFTTETTYSEDEKSILLFIAEQIALAVQKIISEEFLIKARNSAENSSRLKSSLLANMSHELRTPMTGILGFSEILNEELEDPRLKSMAGTIFKSAGRLMSTLNSIIDLSALEADKNSLRLKSVNTRLMMQPLLKIAYSIASDRGLYLRTAIPPDLFVHSDEKLLSQLLHHLIDNALKFTVDGGISISAYKLNKTSTEVTIRISDTGIGIAPEHHRMIFEEFRQVSEGFSRTFEGSGLGLSLCSKISRLVNAKIWVDSVEGKGSDFFVELPVALPGEADEQLSADISPTIRTHRLSRGSVPEVLIVEDNEINRRLAALYLREICNTEMAENGYVAIEKIKRRKYDAILMDINLGAGPDGLSIAHEVRSYEINKNTPIIAVTGYTMHGDREKLLANGCSHYLPKPYDKQTLLKLFSSILYE